jgi:DNA polymerase sigma
MMGGGPRTTISPKKKKKGKNAQHSKGPGRKCPKRLWRLKPPPGEKHSALHNELVEFAWRCSSTFDEVAIASLSNCAIEQAWKRTNQPGGRAIAMPFGSQAVGLALPGGDLDVRVGVVRATAQH